MNSLFHNSFNPQTSQILVIDDENRLCRSLKDLLCARKYNVETCRSGKEALTLFDENSYDLALVDICMEDMTGFQLFEEMSNRSIDTRVIVMTGTASTDTAVKALRMGADDYLKKPFEPEELYSSVGNVLEQHTLAKQLRENEEKYKILFESSFNAISIIDFDTGKFVDCNKSAVEIHDTGSKEALIGKTPAELSPEYQPNGMLSTVLAVQHIQDAYKEGKNEFEWTHCKNDGALFEVLVTLNPFMVGEKKYIMAITKDITYRKQAEYGREKLIKALQASLENVKTLRGLLPICSHCKKIRDDKGYWNLLETHIQEHSYASFSHSICPDCTHELYSHEDWYKKMKERKKHG